MAPPVDPPAAASEAQPLMQARALQRYFRIPASPLARRLGVARDQVVRAVDGVDLDVHAGETLGLVGESGCGKSTLGRTLLRLYEPTAGEVRFEGRDIMRYHAGDLRAFRRRSQIVFQNPYASLNPRKTVREIIGVALRQRGLTDRREREPEIARLLERVGLSPRHVDQYPHAFSGGQRQRIGIARALAVQPRFIVADEPVSSLDVSVQAQILNLLETLQSELALTYLFIAHDLSVIHYVSSRVAVMYLGRIVETGPTVRLYDEPLHPYTQALLSAIPVVERAHRRERIILEGSPPSPIDPPSGCRFHTRCFAKVGVICERESPALREIAPGHRVACHLYNDLPEVAGPAVTPPD